MGRELMKVPADWQHPKDEYGKYKPMHIDRFYEDELKEWFDNHSKWLDGSHPDLLEEPERKKEYPYYAMWAGDPPDVEYYNTRKWTPEEATHIQLYQTTSEGTPITPIFRADELEKLCEYAAENCTTFASYKATKEEWMRMLGDGFVFHQQGNAIFI